MTRRRSVAVLRRPRLVGVFLAALAAALAASHPAPARGDAVGELRLPPGFRAELVYNVPLATQGSWVSLAVDHKGRLIASDQSGGLYRLEPAPLGGDPGLTRVEPIPMNIGMAQGLLAVGEKLYVVMNGQLGAFASGLYRLSDESGDDRYDRLEQLRVFQGSGEHGPHAVIPGPDGKSLYMTCGNYTRLPLFTRSLVPPRWAEDQLLPRLYDPLGHANEIQPPGGWIARTDLDGKNLELFSVGFRNAYDIAFNADGELFTFDSDMEWDIGTPWYRPTRICHVTSGSDFGWRSGNGPWPPYYPDTLPPVVDVGPGSPTGMTFGAETKFPPRYQQALFAGDWSYGNIYAIHLTPRGASYAGEVERFASAMPLAVTDMVVRPQDGALYFAVGGRQSESAVYRIVWTGESAPAATPPAASAASPSSAPLTFPELPAAAESRALRRKLEQFHAGPQSGAVDAAWPLLNHPDRFIRYAARVAVEQQPVEEWGERALAEENAVTRLQALIALARSAAPKTQTLWVESLLGIPFAEANSQERLDLLRAAALGVIRFQPLDDAVRRQLVEAYDSHYPTGDHRVDRELAALLVRLDAPNMVPRLLAVLEQAAAPEEAIDAAMALSVAAGPWTVEQRSKLLDWFDQLASHGGGRSYFGYIVGARDRFIRTFTAEERRALGDRISKPLVEDAAVAATTSRPVVHEWTLDELVTLAEKADPAAANLQNGRRMFSVATCYRCHRVAGEGSSVGPDLTTVGRRFGVRDILRAIVEPNAVISDQYQQMVFETGGRVIVGRVTNLSQDAVLVSTDMLDPKNEITILRAEIDDQYPSPTSLMPSGLLNVLSETEVLDLLAFLRNGGVDPPAPAGAAPAASP